ncbi:MAG: polysaccharide biosynthesis C-terminal domain-containing protein, partial [Pseudodesulfovibrio sp.]
AFAAHPVPDRHARNRHRRLLEYNDGRKHKDPVESTHQKSRGPAAGGLTSAVAGSSGAALGGGLLVACLAESFRSLGQMACGVFQAFENIRREFLLSCAHALAWGAALAVVVVLNLGLRAALAATCLALGVHAFLAWLLVWRRFARPALLRGLPRIWPLLKVSAVIGLAVIVVMNLFRVNVLLLSWLASPEDVARFQVPHDLVLKFQILVQAVMLAAFPVLARLAPTPETRARLLALLHRCMLLAALGMAVAFHLQAEPLLTFLYGAKLAPSAAALRVLAWSAPPLALTVLWSHALVAAEGQRHTLLANTAALGVNIAASLALIPLAGPTGAALAALAAYSVGALLALRFAARLGLAPASPLFLLMGGQVGNIRELFTAIRHPILHGGHA